MKIHFKREMMGFNCCISSKVYNVVTQKMGGKLRDCPNHMFCYETNPNSYSSIVYANKK
jgi:hypothetical protein